jgi:transaldolase
MNKLEQLKTMTAVVADTGDIEAIKTYQPVDATTNPSLLLRAAALPAYRPLLDDAIEWSSNASFSGDEQLERCIEKLAVSVGCEILRHIPGRISTEVSAQYSFDRDAVVDSARRIIALYNDAGIGNERVLIKTAATWQGIEAARVLESENIQCNLTLLFGFAQATACAEAGVFLISPFVGRITDWHKAATGRDYYPPDEDPGVQSVQRIFNYYKQYGYQTIVMGASFRNTGQVTALAGCDQLTISPQLLQELEADNGELQRMLDPRSPSAADDKQVLSEAQFAWAMNEDKMACDKLADGIRNFYADELKLRTYLADLD